MGSRHWSFQISDYVVMILVGILGLNTQIVSKSFFPGPVYRYLFLDVSYFGLSAPGLFWLLSVFLAFSSLGRVVADSSLPRRFRVFLNREDYLDKHNIKRFDD